MAPHEDNEFFAGIRDALIEGLDVMESDRPLARREVDLPDPPDGADSR